MRPADDGGIWAPAALRGGVEAAGEAREALLAECRAAVMWQHLLEQIYERIRPASLNSTGLM